MNNDACEDTYAQSENNSGPRAKIGALAIQVIREVEAEVGMSAWEYAGRNAKFPTKGKRGGRFRTNQPYCFKLLAGGGWLPLNRFYRPLGEVPNNSCFSETYANRGDMPAPVSSRPGESGGYQGYAHLAVHFPKDPRTVDGVWHGRSDGTLWLYNDDPAVRRTYFKRFARLVAAMDPVGSLAWATSIDADELKPGDHQHQAKRLQDSGDSEPYSERGPNDRA